MASDVGVRTARNALDQNRGAGRSLMTDMDGRARLHQLSGCLAAAFALASCEAEHGCDRPVVELDPRVACPTVQRYPGPVPPASPDGFLTLDEQFAWVATQVPGFGGAYWQDQTSPAVYLVDPSPTGAENVRRALARVFDDPAILGHQVEVLPGRYDWLQLQDARYQLASNLPVGEAWDDIDEAINRVVIGWYDPMIPYCLPAAIETLGLPYEIVRLEWSSPVCVD